MIRAKDLHALLKQHVNTRAGARGDADDRRGATLSAAGFDGVEAPRSVSDRGARLGAPGPVAARSDSATCGRRFLCRGRPSAQAASRGVALRRALRDDAGARVRRPRAAATLQRGPRQFGYAAAEPEKADAPATASGRRRAEECRGCRHMANYRGLTTHGPQPEDPSGSATTRLWHRRRAERIDMRWPSSESRCSRRRCMVEVRARVAEDQQLRRAAARAPAEAAVLALLRLALPGEGHVAAERG